MGARATKRAAVVACICLFALSVLATLAVIVLQGRPEVVEVEVLRGFAADAGRKLVCRLDRQRLDELGLTEAQAAEAVDGYLLGEILGRGELPLPFQERPPKPVEGERASAAALATQLLQGGAVLELREADGEGQRVLQSWRLGPGPGFEEFVDRVLEALGAAPPRPY